MNIMTAFLRSLSEFHGYPRHSNQTGQVEVAEWALVLSTSLVLVIYTNLTIHVSEPRERKIRSKRIIGWMNFDRWYRLRRTVGTTKPRFRYIASGHTARAFLILDLQPSPYPLHNPLLPNKLPNLVYHIYIFLL